MPEDLLTDRVYEAAFNPDEWLSVIDGLAAASGAAGGCMAIVDGHRPLGAQQSEVIRQIGECATTNPDAGTVRRFGYACAHLEPGFNVSSAFFPKEMIDGDALVRMKLKHGFGE